MRDISIVAMNDENIIGVKEVSDLSFSIPWSFDALKKELDNKYSKYVVAKYGDTVVGFGGIWLLFDEGHITNIAVHSDYRCHGIADSILEHLMSICKAHNVAGITLEVRQSNKAAILLYEKHKFSIEGIRKNYYHHPKEDGYIMWNHNI